MRVGAVGSGATRLAALLVGLTAMSADAPCLGQAAGAAFQGVEADLEELDAYVRAAVLHVGVGELRRQPPEAGPGSP